MLQTQALKNIQTFQKEPHKGLSKKEKNTNQKINIKRDLIASPDNLILMWRMRYVGEIFK